MVELVDFCQFFIHECYGLQTFLVVWDTYANPGLQFVECGTVDYN